MARSFSFCPNSALLILDDKFVGRAREIALIGGRRQPEASCKRALTCSTVLHDLLTNSKYISRTDISLISRPVTGTSAMLGKTSIYLTTKSTFMVRPKWIHETDLRKKKARPLLRILWVCLSEARLDSSCRLALSAGASKYNKQNHNFSIIWQGRPAKSGCHLNIIMKIYSKSRARASLSCNEKTKAVLNPCVSISRIYLLHIYQPPLRPRMRHELKSRIV